MDFMASARGDQTGSHHGSVRVFSGFSGVQIFSWHGDLQYDYFAALIAPAGDVDADGRPDVIVGAYDSPSGRAYVFSGATGGILHLFTGESAGDAFHQVAGAGDVNADGYADLIVGGPENGSNGVSAGIAKVYSGRDGTTLHVFHGSPGERLGYSVAGVGDIDGDGYDDVLVGAIGSNLNGTRSGRASVYSGRTGAVLYTFVGNGPEALLGYSVSGAGDVDADGVPDTVMGSPGEGGMTFPYPFEGSARVHSGQNGSILHQWWGVGPEHRRGELVAGMGDVNGDGHADVGVKSGTYPSGGSQVGNAYVHSGADGSVLYDLGHAALGFNISWLNWAGDINGDTYADILLGRVSDQPSGSVYVFSGFEHLISFCAGDGSGTACPCGNTGAPGRGCANSGGSGALLTASGSASLADDELAFQGAGLLPGQAALLFAGNNALNGGQGIPFGDGLRCAGGGLRRLGVRVPDVVGNTGWGPGLSALGAWSPGDERRFQVWYRDPGPLSPCGTSFNTTNGIEVFFSL